MSYALAAPLFILRTLLRGKEAPLRCTISDTAQEAITHR